MDFDRNTQFPNHLSIGTWGESAATVYLQRNGFEIIGRNIARKTGELDIVAQKGSVLHIVEVKTVQCRDFPGRNDATEYNPAYNLHPDKLRKVVRTGEWYVLETGWEGEWQVDAILVWIRRKDGVARVTYLPQVV